MKRRLSKRALAVAALAASVLCAPAHGALPLIAAGMGKQLIKNMLIDGIKSQLIGSLGDMGCKGAALASVLSSTTGGGSGLAGGVAALSGGIPGMPAGLPGLTGAMPPAGGMPGMPVAGAMTIAPGALGAMGSPQMMAMLEQFSARGTGAMPAMSPEHAAQMQAGMVAMQQAMAQPLSRSETLAVFDELAELGVMTPAMRSEVRDCVMLAPPSSSAALGMSGSMVKNMVLPPLRDARAQMAALTPEQREQLAGEIAQALAEASPEDRKAFQEGFAAGFFPPDVVDAVKAKLR